MAAFPDALIVLSVDAQMDSVQQKDKDSGLPVRLRYGYSSRAAA